MKSRPILFTGAMVRALLDGSKTQTRRAVKTELVMGHESFCAKRKKGYAHVYLMHRDFDVVNMASGCPHGQPGDQLWVREAWCGEVDGHTSQLIYNEDGDTYQCLYRADGHHVTLDDGDGFTKTNKDGSEASPWRPSIHMPRWASRTTLEITGVRVEKLQDISETDAIAEGCTKNHNGYYWGGPHAVSGLKQMGSAKSAYRDLWGSINGPGSWDLNPWVWVIEFRRIESTHEVSL